ncbi:MAG TPA: N-acetyl-D-Glu racemase DgcA [Stellaceae bacterium]|nr:N-acetyl-D-Glu racemase DgcA [Stellaceae bacterium]HYC15142.1 N-acetyl-D-Glu racemase DgcA [Stellaceae bacterium]
MRRLTVHRESFPLAQAFTISRGSRTSAEVVTAEIGEGAHRGRGEGVPYSRYGETVAGVVEALEAMASRIAEGLDREALQGEMQPGAARNALDAALWDLEAKVSGKPVARLAGLDPPGPITTAYTLSLGTPEAMGRAAAEHATRPLLKIKLTGDGDLERVRAVRTAAPGARLIVDANEAWSAEHFERYAPALAELGVALIEQPLPAGRDEALASLPHPVPVCADEACHTTDDLPALVGRYEVVNIKLDKTGGLTEALRLASAARSHGFRLMVGCMVGTSLAMAPAILVAQGAEFVDLDAPLLLARDRQPGLRYEGSVLFPPKPTLWG